MPYKDKTAAQTYARNYKRRQRLYKPYYHLYNPIVILILQEIKDRAILPRHMYEWKFVMKDLLRNYFKKRVIKKNKLTNVITSSFYIFNNET